MDCIFCKLANGNIPTNMVYEDDKVAAFRDMSPVTPVHILVVPKKHYASLEDVPMDEMVIELLIIVVKMGARKYRISTTTY